jgi:hypothetical protein
LGDFFYKLICPPLHKYEARSVSVQKATAGLASGWHSGAESAVEDKQGCQICLGTTYQNGERCTKGPQSIPNGNATYQIVVKYSKWPQNILSFPRHSKIYPNIDFWFENIPSGNPDLKALF